MVRMYFSAEYVNTLYNTDSTIDENIRYFIYKYDLFYCMMTWLKI